MTTKRCKIEDDEGENKSDDEDQWIPKKIKIEKGSPQSAAAKPCKRSSQPVTRRGRGRGRGRGRTTVAIKKEIIESEMKLQSNQTLVLKSQDVPVASTSKVQDVPTGNFNTTWNVEEVLSQQIRIPRRVSLNIIHLLDEENTIPFIARYRRELTDNMDADGLREAEQTLKELRFASGSAFHSKLQKLSALLHQFLSLITYF
uniref:Tex-like protein N-terminal domain-containing protein n=1 Tax=Eptatretus burgeri TaxID=7764 RepID=A0A8C4QK13_EPTBU